MNVRKLSHHSIAHYPANNIRRQNVDSKEEKEKYTQCKKGKRKLIAKQRTLFKSKYKIIFINKEEKKTWKINVYIFVLNKTQNRDIKHGGRDRTTKTKRRKVGTMYSWEWSKRDPSETSMSDSSLAGCCSLKVCAWRPVRKPQHLCTRLIRNESRRQQNKQKKQKVKIRKKCKSG